MYLEPAVNDEAESEKYRSSPEVCQVPEEETLDGPAHHTQVHHHSQEGQNLRKDQQPAGVLHQALAAHAWRDCQGGGDQGGQGAHPREEVERDVIVDVLVDVTRGVHDEGGGDGKGG